jgi:uncharacterized Tic20 family protein
MSRGPYDDQQGGPGGESPGELTSETTNWAMLCHLAALAMIGLPTLGHVIGPLIVWLLKRHDHPFIDENGKESVNFQISVTIYTLLILPLLCVVIGIPLLVALWIANIVLIIVASIKASGGEMYRYPLTIRLLR